MKRILLVIALLALIGCQTTSRMPKTAKTYIAFESSNLLYTGGLGEAGVPGFTKRITEYLTSNLSRRGIVGSTVAGASEPSAKLTIDLTTIENATVSDIGFWAPIVRQQPKVKYTATFVSSEGATLFRFDAQQDDQSLDNLSKKIADRITGRIAGCYQ